MFKRFARAGVLATALVAMTASATFAHECYNASRSEKGNAGANHAAVWSTESVAGLFAELHHFGIPGVNVALDAEQQQVAFQAAVAMGVPAEVTIFFGRVTIGEHGRAFAEGGKGTDGKGIDHFFEAHGGSIVTAYFIGLNSGQ